MSGGRGACVEIEREPLIALRLEAHGLRATAQSEPCAVVERMLALQGQDHGAVQRAIALRCRDGDLGAVQAALADGRLVRGWPMRGTLFVTTPRALAALLHLDDGRTLRASARVRSELGLDEAVLERAWAIARERLTERPASRAELVAAWQAGGVSTQGQRSYHLIVQLALRGRLHWGRLRDGEPLLVASEGRIVLDPRDTDRESLRAALAGRYLEGHGPATVADLAWWMRQPLTAVRRALEAAAGLTTRSHDGRTWWLTEAQARRSPALPDPLEIHLVPAFDEYYLGYTDRTLISSPAMQARVVPGNNGVFRPLVLSGGRVVGTWRQRPGGRNTPARVEVELVEAVSDAVRQRVEVAAAAWPF